VAVARPITTIGNKLVCSMTALHDIYPSARDPLLCYISLTRSHFLSKGHKSLWIDRSESDGLNKHQYRILPRHLFTTLPDGSLLAPLLSNVSCMVGRAVEDMYMDYAGKRDVTPSSQPNVQVASRTRHEGIVDDFDSAETPLDFLIPQTE
jgi:hypothetical protein